jgi:hypothetical protein
MWVVFLLYYSGSSIFKKEVVFAVDDEIMENETGDMRNAYKILAGGPERKRPLGRTRLRWDDNTAMDLKQGVWMWIGSSSSLMITEAYIYGLEGILYVRTIRWFLTSHESKLQ